jgi:hypothetical protein
MGITPQPTDAQRENDASGVAYQERQSQGQIGAFHYVDAYDLMIERTGMILEDLMDKTLDTAREVPVRKPDDSSAVIRINDPAGSVIGPQGQLSGDPIFTNGDYRVTISTGPATESQRQEAADFVDMMVGQLPLIAQIAGPAKAGQLLAKSIKLKQLGPIGDEMEQLFAPPAMTGPNGQPLSPEMQAAQQQIQQLQQELQAAKQQIASKVAETQAKTQGDLQVAQLKVQATSQDKAADRAVKLDIAAIQAKIETMAMVMEELQRIGGLNENAAARLHEAGQAALDRHQTATENVKDRLHEHVVGAVQHAQAKDLAATTAALQPDPAAGGPNGQPADPNAAGNP